MKNRQFISCFLSLFLAVSFLIPSFPHVQASESDRPSIQIVGGGIPAGMFFDPSYLNVQQQRLYVADSSNNRVQAFIRGNVFQLAFGGFGQNEREFDKPAGICSDDSNLYVVDSLNARVQIFDSKGTYVSQFGSFGSENGKFNMPTDIATDGKKLYVLDTGNNRVQIFDSKGSFLSTFGVSGSEDGNFKNPLGIEIAKGKIFVSDTGNNRVQIFDETGKFVSVFGFAGTEEKAFNRPKGITFSDEKIYIIDSGNKRIHLYDEAGVYTSVINLETSVDPYGIAILDGKLLVSDMELNQVLVYGFDGKLNSIFGSKPEYLGNFVKPIAVTTTETEIYVLDEMLRTVQVFDSKFVPVRFFAEKEIQKAALIKPIDVSIYKNKVYILDSAKPAISVFTEQGIFEKNIGAYGTKPGAFISPQGLYVYDDKIYVSDAGNSRVQILDLTGNPIITFGDYGSRTNQFFNMKGISAFDDKVFVIDSGNSRVAVYDEKGEILNSYGKKGFETGSYYGPNGIHVDVSGKIYIADMLNNRIQVLNTTTDQSKVFGQFGSIFQDPENFAKGKTDYRYDIIPGNFVYPSDINVFGNYIVVVDPYNVRVQLIPFSSVFQHNPLAISPDYLDFGSISSDTTVSRSFMLRNTGGNYIEGTVSCELPFITIEPTHFKGSSQEVHLSIEGSKLEAGKTYTATVLVKLLDGQSRELNMQFTAGSEPDFYAETTPFYVAAAEQEYKIPIKIIPQNGFQGIVTFSALELPKNTIPSFDPPSVNLPTTDTTYLILKSSSQYIEAGEYHIQIQADAAKGNKSHRLASTFVFKQKLDLVPHTVLGELFTATWCLNCVYSHRAMDRLFEEFGKETVTFVEYYVESTKDHPVPRLSWIESEQREKWYMSDKGLPTIFFDGTDYLKGVANTEGEMTDETKETNMYNSYREKVIEKSKESSVVTISVRSIFDSQRRMGKVHASIKALDNLPYKAPHIYFAVVESNIPYQSVNGDKMHHFVLRDFVTPTNDDKHDYLGTAMKLKSGDTFGAKGDEYSLDVNFTLVDFFNLANISLIVWVQDNVTKKVLQSSTYPVKVINYRSFSLVSDGSLMQEKTKGESGSITFDIVNDGTVRDAYQIKAVNKSLVKWNYTISVNGKQEAGIIPSLSLDSFEKAKITVDFQIPADAPVNALQEFSFLVESLSSRTSKVMTSTIHIIESRPPDFILEIEEPASMDLMAGDMLEIKMKVTPDPYVEGDVTFSLKGEYPDLETFSFDPNTGKAPLETTLRLSFYEITPEKTVNLLLEVEAGSIVKTAVISINVLRNPDAVPPVLRIAYPSDGLLTNKPEMTVSGMTDPGVSLMIGEKDVPVEKNGSFEHTMTLLSGENEIHIVAINQKGLTSEATLLITLDIDPPELVIETEIPVETCDSEILIKGYTEPNCVVKVGNQDLQLDENGHFEYVFVLSHGWNGIEISSIDPASNETKVSKEVQQVIVILLQIGNTNASVNKKPVVLEAAPYIKNGRTMVPIRFIAESLGAEVGWDDATKSITIVKGDISIFLKIGSMDAFLKEEGVLGQEKIVLEAAPEIQSGRTFVPLRFVSEAFGAKLDWNSQEREITIKQ